MTKGSLMKVKRFAECPPPLGAFCNTFDLHLKAIIGLENRFLVYLRVAFLHRFYCTWVKVLINVLSIIVYVEWASRVNFVTIFGDLYQNKLWLIYNNLNQFAHLSSTSGPSNDVIKMATIVLRMYIYKTSYLKQ